MARPRTPPASSPPSKAKAPARPAPPKSKRTGPIVAAVVAAVVILAVIVAVVANQSGGDNASASPGDEQTRPVTVTGTPLPPLPDSGTDAGIGAAAPTLTGAAFNGTPVTVGGATGKPQLLLFVAHWCPHCNAEVPRVVGLINDNKLPADLAITAISTGANADAPHYPPSGWLEKTMKWPDANMADSADQTAAVAYGLPGYPYWVVVGADGKVLGRGSGEQSADEFLNSVTTALNTATPN